MFRGIHEKNGVEFKLGAQVQQVNGSKDKAASVTLSDGQTLPCDVVVVAVGVQPNAAFVKGVTKGGGGWCW